MLGMCPPCESLRCPSVSVTPGLLSFLGTTVLPPLSSVCMSKCHTTFQLRSQGAGMPDAALWAPGLRLVYACSGMGLAPRTREVWRGSGHYDSEWALASLLCLCPGLAVSTELCPPSALITSYSMSFLQPFFLAHTLVWFRIPFLYVVCGQLYNLKLNFTASSQCNLLRKGYLM